MYGMLSKSAAVSPLFGSEHDPSSVTQALQQIQVAPLLQDAGHVVPHDARLRVRHDDRAAEPLDERRQILRRPGIGRRDLLRIARGARRSRERHLGVRHELLVVLERVVVVGPAGAGRSRPARDDARSTASIGKSAARACRRRFGSDLAGSPCGMSVPVQDVRARRHQMAEPRGPRAVVGDSAEAGIIVGAALRRRRPRSSRRLRG